MLSGAFWTTLQNVFISAISAMLPHENVDNIKKDFSCVMLSEVSRAT